MASTSTALTSTANAEALYKLDESQVLKASRALIKHVQDKATTTKSEKKDLLADERDLCSTPIWLTLTTKRHITDTERLKPKLISVPHPLHTVTGNTSICLITADPQRTYKDIVESEAFPAELGKRITRVIGMSKLKEKYSQYEAQRQLFAEHDLFLADDRIITRLSGALGKTFYKSTVKRPIPINLAAAPARENGKRITRAKGATQTRRKGKEAPHDPSTGHVEQVVREIQKAISAALVHLSPSTNTAIKVGFASWSPEDVAANVQAVVGGLVEKFVPAKWRGVRSLHLLGHGTAALPIWLADELWTSEADVVEKVDDAGERANVGRKRKAIEAVEGVVGDPDQTQQEKKKTKKRKTLKTPAADSNDVLDKDIAQRKAILEMQMDEARLDDDDEPLKLPLVQKTKTKTKPKPKAPKKVVA